MENLGKKVGFLKGIMEGMDFDASTANGKLMVGIVDLLGDLSDRMEIMDELMDDLNDYVESIDDDLSELENERDEGEIPDDFFDDDEDQDFEDDFDDGEDHLHLLHPGENAADFDDDEALAGNLCPECSRMFFTSLDDPEDAEYLCPHCGKHIRPMALTPDNAPIAKPISE